MTDENDLKAAVRAVWDAVRHDRRARRKQFSQAELNESAVLLRAHGDALSALASRAPANGADDGAATGAARLAERPKKAAKSNRAKASGSKKTKKS